MARQNHRPAWKLPRSAIGERTAARSRATGFVFGLIGRSAAMRQLFDLLPPVAESESTVLVKAPAARAKELFPGIHQLSRRHAKKFMPSTAVAAGHVAGKANCSATKPARHPTHARTNPAASRWPRVEPSFWTKSATSRGHANAVIARVQERVLNRSAAWKPCAATSGDCRVEQTAPGWVKEGKFRETVLSRAWFRLDCRRCASAAKTFPCW